MRTGKKKTWMRLKVLGLAGLGLAVGVILLFLSRQVVRQAAPPAATAPASAPSSDSGQPQQPGHSPAEPLNRQAAAQNLSGFLFMFGLSSFGLTLLCLGWLAYDLYESRPAWKKQTKYPRMR